VRNCEGEDNDRLQMTEVGSTKLGDGSGMQEDGR